MVAVLVTLSPSALLIRRRTVPSATPDAPTATKESVLSAGRTAQMAIAMMECSVLSPDLMVVALATFSGEEESARMITAENVKRVVPCGIPNVEMASMLLAAASARLTAPMAKPTSECLAQRDHMAAQPAHLLVAAMALK